jgi:hypothetical protein
MAVRQLDKSRWKAYFDGISDLLVGKRVEIEIAALNIGDQIEAEWLPLVGMVYDPKNDIIEITLEDPDHHIDHMIHSPREVYVDGSPVAVTDMEIVDREGTRQIIKLRDPLMLPAASSAGG